MQPGKEALNWESVDLAATPGSVFLSQTSPFNCKVFGVCVCWGAGVVKVSLYMF